MKKIRLKDYNSQDTIAAIATFPASAALGVIRISGKKAISLAAKIFKSANGKDIKLAQSHRLYYGWIIEKAKNKKSKKNTESIVDEVIVSLMRKPRSYTAEDVVEISSHGGVLVLNKILDLIIKTGARQAQPGEFSYRALVNGRINLIQAEAIRDIVEAKTDQALRLAQVQLNGQVNSKIELIQQGLKDLFSQLEAQINFPEDQVNISLGGLKKRLNELSLTMDELLEGARQAKILKEGLRCVICGKTNAGKSTLFNCLLNQERVIVSRFPGTTRDLIEETINIRGIPLRIYDTAGLIEPKDLITRKALEKTELAFKQADLVIFLLDSSRPLNKDDLFLLKKIDHKKTIIAINKIDLKPKLQEKKLIAPTAIRVRVSALCQKGIVDLEKAIFKAVYAQGLDRENIIFLNHYQEQFLKTAKQSIVEAQANLENGHPIDFASLSLKSGLESLAKLTGEITSQEVLENIFSNFCIGK